MRGGVGDKHGLASIMDAFIFLLAMMALGSFLVANANDGGEGQNTAERHALIERTHAVLASLTLRLPNSSSNDGQVPCVEITSLVRTEEGSDRLILPDWAIPEARRIIVGLLGPGWGFDWAAMDGGSRSVLVGSNHTGAQVEVFASRIEILGAGGVEYSLIFTAWPSAATSAY